VGDDGVLLHQHCFFFVWATCQDRGFKDEDAFSIFMCMLCAASFLAFENSRPQIALLI
jgi:hypothetical protein